MANNSFLGTEEYPGALPTGDEKTLAILAHALTFIFPIMAPLIIYLIKKNDSDFVAYHAKESLNFQITLFIIVIGLFITVVGILLLWVVGIVATVLVIVACVRAGEGVLYKYPFSLRLIR